MKKLTVFTLLFVLLCNGYAQFEMPDEEDFGVASCGAALNPIYNNPASLQQKFIPNDTTPIKTIKMDIHIWRNDNGTGNRWLDSQAYRDTMKMAVNWLNRVFSQNAPYCLHIPGAQFISDTRVRFEIDTFYYYDNSEIANADQLITISNYMVTHHPDRLKNFMYHFVPGIHCKGAAGESSGYQKYTQCIGKFSEYPTAGSIGFYLLGEHMAHEFGHNFGLKHTYEDELSEISHREYLWDVFGTQRQSWCTMPPPAMLVYTMAAGFADLVLILQKSMLPII